MARLRPARLNAAGICGYESLAASAGVGAMASTARASGLADTARADRESVRKGSTHAARHATRWMALVRAQIAS